MREFFEKNPFEEKLPQKENLEKSKKEKEKTNGKQEGYWKEYYQKHKEEVRGRQIEYSQRKERISLLKFFEEEKPITLKELLEKRGISEVAGTRKLKEIGNVRKIIDDCKKMGLVTEIEENVFQVNQESPSFKILKKFLEREKKKTQP